MEMKAPDVGMDGGSQSALQPFGEVLLVMPT
jgi:hypothetical protein